MCVRIYIYIEREGGSHDSDDNDMPILPNFSFVTTSLFNLYCYFFWAILIQFVFVLLLLLLLGNAYSICVVYIHYKFYHLQITHSKKKKKNHSDACRYYIIKVNFKTSISENFNFKSSTTFSILSFVALAAQILRVHMVNCRNCPKQ